MLSVGLSLLAGAGTLLLVARRLLTAARISAAGAVAAVVAAGRWPRTRSCYRG